MQQKNQQQKSNRQRRQLLTVSINGSTALVDPNTITKSNRTVHHGEFNGVKVNSPATAIIGDTVIVWPSSKKSQAYSMPIAAMGVLSTQFLASQSQNDTSNK